MCSAIKCGHVQSIKARDDVHPWAQTYDRDLADVFAIESAIAKAIADQLQAKLLLREEKPSKNCSDHSIFSRL